MYDTKFLFDSSSKHGFHYHLYKQLITSKPKLVTIFCVRKGGRYGRYYWYMFSLCSKRKKQKHKFKSLLLICNTLVKFRNMSILSYLSIVFCHHLCYELSRAL